MKNDISNVILGASLASIALSVGLFVTGKRETGIFIGLWAPTFLALGSFFNISADPDKLQAQLENAS